MFVVCLQQKVGFVGDFMLGNQRVQSVSMDDRSMTSCVLEYLYVVVVAAYTLYVCIMMHATFQVAR